MVQDDPFAPSILRVHSGADVSHGASVAPTPEDEPVVPIPGVRTPRRVQWTSDHVINVPHEQQVTDSNIDNVNDALERFQTGRYRPSRLSVASAGSEDEHEHEHTYPPHDKEHQDEDYDYRLDTDPVEEDRDDGGFEHELLDSGVNEHVSGTFIPPGETDGLPSVHNQDHVADKAEELVRQHTGRWGNLRNRVKRGSLRRRGGDKEDKVRTSDDSTTRLTAPPAVLGSVNGNAPAPSNPPAHMGGQSVLSSLLALYNQQHSGNTSGTTTAVTTPVSSRPPSIASTDDEERKRPWTQSKPGTPENEKLDEKLHEGKRNRSSTSIADRSPTPKHDGLRGTFQRAAHNLRQSDRPKAARSDAGVFGALIQNTGGMAAAAAPSASTLIPSAKRPGYHLSRYSLDSKDGRSHPVSHPASHPPSRPPSRPPSVRSSTVVDDDHDDGALMLKTKSSERTKSSDDLVKKRSALNLKALESATQRAEQWMKPSHTPLTEDERKRKEWEAEKRRRKKDKAKRKKQEVFIIQHVAAILTRQQFIMKLARCLMMFGSPSHRLETQIQATARVLEIHAQVVYIPGTILISFMDDSTHTSETKFLKQTTGLDLGKLLSVHNTYWDVVHDKISVDTANTDLDKLMTMPPRYNTWQTIIVGMLCSSFIVVPSFHGSFIDALMAAPLGGLLIIIQVLSAKNDMLSNVFEITIATLISFLSAVLASTHYFCFTALVSGGVVLILPGYIVLTGALELASRNITAGAVRIGYSVIYSLFLGFGISAGAEIYTKIRNRGVQNVNDWACKATHYDGAPWYMTDPSQWWYFLCVPGYALWLSLRNQQPFAKELPIMVLIACGGWVVNFFSAKAFQGRSDIVSALGAFTVGLLGNTYGRFLSNGASFPVMVTGILMQLPSGLANGGIFNFAAQGQTKTEDGTDVTTNSQEQWSSGFSVAAQLVSVAIGLTVGLFVAAVVTHPLGGSRRRGAGIFSF